FLARLEVLQLDALLRLSDGRGHPVVGDDLVFLGAGAIHDARDAIRAEQPHQIVLERQEKHALARIALATGAAAQLPVDAPRFVPLSPDDDEAARGIVVAGKPLDLLGWEVGPLDLLAERGLVRRDPAHLTLLHPGPKLDVGPAARHVGSDRDGA